MDELRKKIEENTTSHDSEWEKVIDRVNPVLDLISADKLSVEDSGRFWAMHESVVTKLQFEGRILFTSAISSLGALCENIVIDEVHRSRSKYVAPEPTVYLFHEPSAQYNNIIIDESSRIKSILLDVYKDNSRLITFDSREFEEMVAELLAKQGFKVELTKRTKDGGYDIIALLNYNHHNPMKFLVECKRRSKNKIGVEVIRSFKNVVDSTNVNRGIFVTTSYFTRGSWDEQKKYPYLLDYRDKDQVLEWVKGYFNK